MSFSRIESGGNQVKDSMTQLTEVIQKSQSQLEAKFNNSFKEAEQQGKKVSDSKSSETDSCSNQTQNANNAQNSDDTKSVEQYQTSDSRVNTKSEESDHNSETTQDEPQPSEAQQKSEDKSLLAEQQLNQSDLLLLALLITPQAQPTEKKVEKEQNNSINSLLESFEAGDTSKNTRTETKDLTDLNKNSNSEINIEEIVQSTQVATSENSTPSTEQKNQENNKNPTQENQIELKNDLMSVLTPQDKEIVATQAIPEDLKANSQATPTPQITNSKTTQKITSEAKEIMSTLTQKTSQETSLETEPKDTKKKALKIDDLIFELRHPEMVLQKSMTHETSQMTHERVSTQNLEKAQAIQNQFLSAMKTIIDRHEEKMVIHLDPPEWGKIDVQLKLQNKELNVNIRTEQAFVKESLEKGVPELRQAFSGQGLQLGHLNIGMGQNMAREHQQEENQNNPQTVIKKQNTKNLRWRDPRSIVDRVI